MNGPQRYSLVDLIRILAVWLMIFFHFSYDLKLFGVLHFDVHRDLFWWFLPRFIVFLFLISAGMGLYLAHFPHIQWRKFNVRLIKISVGALIISLSTYVMYPESWVYFGTLHCIVVCSLAALPLLGRPKLTIAIAILLLVPTLAGYTFWWPQMGHRSLDYIPFLPWFGVMCLGIFMAQIGLYRWSPIQVAIPGWVSWSGRHSLLIYLVHQPILFGGLTLFFKLKS